MQPRQILAQCPISPRSILLSIALTALLVATLVSASAAQSFSVLYTFKGGSGGALPYGTVSMDREGNIYGVNAWGGYLKGVCTTQGCGQVFKLTQKGSGWILVPLHLFTGGDDGISPIGGVALAPDGSLYGTTTQGGNGTCSNGLYSGCGIVFKLDPPATFCKSATCLWTETVLHRFTGVPDGDSPEAGVTLDASGNVYSTTTFGGDANCPNNPNGCGTVFEVSHSTGQWIETPLYRFTGGNDGEYPYSGTLSFDPEGNVYGTTSYGGGSNNAGTVFELNPSGSGWTENVLLRFASGGYGYYPYGGVIFDQLGNLYGTTVGNGTGTVFELARSNGSWLPSLIWNFGGNGLGGPVGNLVMDGSGALYGTTIGEGAYSAGNIFKLTPGGGGWTYTDLYDFTGGADGGYPQGTPVMDATGTLYGFASGGGGGSCTGGCGVAWKLTP